MKHLMRPKVNRFLRAMLVRRARFADAACVCSVCRTRILRPRQHRNKPFMLRAKRGRYAEKRVRLYFFGTILLSLQNLKNAMK